MDLIQFKILVLTMVMFQLLQEVMLNHLLPGRKHEMQKVLLLLEPKQENMAQKLKEKFKQTSKNSIIITHTSLK